MGAEHGLGMRLAEAIATKDRAGLTQLLAPHVSFRGLTPSRSWEGSSPEEVAEVLFRAWFEDADDIEELLEVEEGAPVEDTAHLRYRLAVANPYGRFTVEQQAYYRAEDGRIDYLRMLCSGFRPRG